MTVGASDCAGDEREALLPLSALEMAESLARPHDRVGKICADENGGDRGEADNATETADPRNGLANEILEDPGSEKKKTRAPGANRDLYPSTLPVG